MASREIGLGLSNDCAVPELIQNTAMPHRGGDVDCYSFIAVDFHHILLASLPAHSLTLRPAGLLNRLKRPLSRGSSPAGSPAEPLVRYQINRQLSGWYLPPLVIRAFGAHGQTRTSAGATAMADLPRGTDIADASF